MLSARHKAQILIRAGWKVPPCPAPSSPPLQQGHIVAPAGAIGQGQMQAAAGLGTLEAAWQREIDRLYARYAAERAARSLREAEEAERLARLRRTDGR